MLDMSRGRRFRRGFVGWKVLAAGVFAAGGVGVAGWRVLGDSGGEAAPERAPGRVITTVDGDGNEAVASYRKTKGSEAAVVVGELAGLAIGAARGVEGFGTQGEGTAAELAKELGRSVALTLQPLVSGDHAAFLAAMRALGAALPGDLDGEHPLFAQLKDKLAGARVDLTRLEVKAHENRKGGARRLVERDGEGVGNRNVNERMTEMRGEALFPGTRGRLDERAVDVVFPFLAKVAEREEWFGLVLVWNPESRVWQPGAFQVIAKEVTVTP